jgi:hypothetical protein
MTSLLSIAHCPAGSIALGEDVGGGRGPKLVRILVGHFTAGVHIQVGAEEVVRS